MSSNLVLAFACLKDKICRINIRTRKSCQFCRFKKCLQAGMKPNWVLPEGQRRKRNSSTNSSGSELISMQVILVETRDLVPEIIDSGPLCITDLFQNKTAAILTQNKIHTFQKLFFFLFSHLYAKQVFCADAILFKTVFLTMKA